MASYPQFNQNDYRNNYQPYAGAGANVATMPSVMRRVYLNMTLGLVVTAIVSLFCASQGFVYYMYTHSWVMWALIIAEFGLVIGINGAINKISAGVATLLFFLFSAVNGLMLSSIFVVYTGGALARTFFITAGTFGAMSLYGYFTNRDLSKMGGILTMCLIGLFIAMLVNLFLKSSTMDWIVSIAGVLIFIGLTAWDTQRIRQIAAVTPAEMTGKVAALGALTLYLDFINLFLYLLRFFGSSRD